MKQDTIKKWAALIKRAKLLNQDMSKIFNQDVRFRRIHFANYTCAPAITICYIKKGSKVHAGVAFCSPKDQPNKLRGQFIAYQRAFHKGLPIRVDHQYEDSLCVAIHEAKRLKISWMAGFTEDDLV